jgi:hypothetical protein
VTFGTPLDADFESAEAVAKEVDRQIISGYCLHPTNLHAYRRLHGTDAPVPEALYREEGDCTQEAFDARIAALPPEHQPYALAIYANAVVSKLALANSSQTPC